MRHVPFVDYDFCDFVALMLTAMAFVLCIYMEVGA